ncbi:MAG: hypothetical protein ACK4UJ_05120 [Leptonema sp. (in: bacteria)]
MKENLNELLLKIKDRIREVNLKIYEDPIPTSDIIYKNTLYDLVSSPDLANYYLKILIESNFIFVINLVKPDPILKISGIDGYVVTEKSVLESLLVEYKKRLEHIYELEKRKRKGAEVILRELMPKIKEYNNTTLGKVLNITIMLEQLIRVIEEEPEKYTEEAKTYLLRQLLPEERNIQIDYEIENEKNESTIVREKKRAIDTKEYKELSKMNLAGNWGKAVNKFGVQFLIRVHLRKHEYDIIKKLLFQKRIAKEEDLLFLRDSLRKMEENYYLDKEIRKYFNEIKELKRIVQLKLNQFYLIKKKYESSI